MCLEMHGGWSNETMHGMREEREEQREEEVVRGWRGKKVK